MRVIILSYIIILINISKFIKYRREFNDNFILINNDLILIKDKKFEFNNTKEIKILFIEKDFNNYKTF